MVIESPRTKDQRKSAHQDIETCSMKSAGPETTGIGKRPPRQAPIHTPIQMRQQRQLKRKVRSDIPFCVLTANFGSVRLPVPGKPRLHTFRVCTDSTGNNTERSFPQCRLTGGRSHRPGNLRPAYYILSYPYRRQKQRRRQFSQYRIRHGSSPASPRAKMPRYTL